MTYPPEKKFSPNKPQTLAKATLFLFIRVLLISPKQRLCQFRLSQAPSWDFIHTIMRTLP